MAEDIEVYLRRMAQQENMEAGRTMLSKGYKKVSEWGTPIVGNLIAATTGAYEPDISEETRESIKANAQTAAGFIVPQDLWEVGMGLGTGVGGYAAKALKAGKKAAVALRGGGMVTGGTAGAYLDDPTAYGAAIGAGKSTAAALVGEGVGQSISYLRKVGMDRATAKANARDAMAWRQAAKQNPLLTDLNGQPIFVANSAGEIRDLALGHVKIGNEIKNKGLAHASRVQEQYADKIDAIIANRPPRPLSPYEHGAASAVPQAQSAGLFPIVTHNVDAPKKYGTFREAREALSDLGIMLKNKNALDPSVKLRDVEKAYKEGEFLLDTWLDNYDKTGQAKRFFHESQAKYKAQRGWLDATKQALRTEGSATDVSFNSRDLQHYLNQKEVAVVGKFREGWDAARNAVRLGGQMGVRDQMKPRGVVGTAAGILPWGNVPRHLAYPQLVGSPFDIGNTGRTMLDLGAGRAGAGVSGMDLPMPQSPLKLFAPQGLPLEQ